MTNWIGVKLGLQWEQRKLQVSIPGKKLTELIEEIKGLTGKGMLSFKTLRSFTGRASWCAGVLPHARWAVNILHAGLASYGVEVASGREEKRRAGDVTSDGRHTWGTKPGCPPAGMAAPTSNPLPKAGEAHCLRCRLPSCSS